MVETFRMSEVTVHRVQGAGCRVQGAVQNSKMYTTGTALLLKCFWMLCFLFFVVVCFRVFWEFLDFLDFLFYILGFFFVHFGMFRTFC